MWLIVYFVSVQSGMFSLLWNQLVMSCWLLNMHVEPHVAVRTPWHVISWNYNRASWVCDGIVRVDLTDILYMNMEVEIASCPFCGQGDCHAWKYLQCK